jgi:hypothetical protein
MNYLALRAYNMAGRKVSFNDMSRMTGPVPVQGALIPVLVTFADPGNPATARPVPPDGMAAALGRGFHLHNISVEVVPNGFWPLDFGGPLGEPMTRGIEAKLPWWNRPDDPARTALQAAGLQGSEAIDPKQVHAEIAMQPRAGPGDIDPARAGGHDRPAICGGRLDTRR